MRKIFALLTTIVVICAIASILPAVSFADDSDNGYAELSDLIAQAKEIKSTIDASKSDYMNAVQKSEEIAAQKKEAKKDLSRARKRLEIEQERLSEIAIVTYKHENTFLDALLGSDSLESFLAQLSYYNRIADQRAQTVDEIARLEAELSAIPPKLEEQEKMAKEEAAAAEMSKAAFENELEELKPRIQELRAAFSDKLRGLQGADQLSEILDYLEGVGNVTESQMEIVKQAYRTSYAGGDRCEAWAEAVYRNAGFDVPNLISAYEGWETYSIDDNQEGIPVGSYVYGSGTSVPYSHVGILVAEGMVLDNEAAAAGHTAVPLDQWLSWQTAVSSNNGKSGWFGWGHPDWIDFNDD